MTALAIWIAMPLAVDVSRLGLLIAQGKLIVDLTGTSPQVRPVVTMLRALKEGDFSAYQAAFSEASKRRWARKDWEHEFKALRKNYQEAWGDWKLQDFTFYFVGEKEKGHVFFKYRDEESPGIRVIQEKGVWKMEEYD